MEYIRALGVTITANTSTTYTECKKMPLWELTAFFEDVKFYIQMQNEEYRKQFNPK